MTATPNSVAIPSPRPGWRGRAICATSDDLDLWFPEGVRGATFTMQAAAAQRVCSRCPVVRDCLFAQMRAEQGKGRDNRFGVFGGTTGTQRWQLERKLLGARDLAA